MVGDEVVVGPKIEEGQEVTFAVVRSGEHVRLSEPLTVSVGTSVNGEIVLPKSVTFEAGESVVKFSATIRRDTSEEATEAVRVFVSASGLFQDNIDAWVRVIDGEPLTMDFNRDGEVNRVDSNMLCAAISAASTDAVYDLNGDGNVDKLDHETLRRSNDIPLGDVNWDGIFDSTDIVAAFAAGKFKSGQRATWSTGDWNWDGVFDVMDLEFALTDYFYRR
jgi:hypothetical protein